MEIETSRFGVLSIDDQRIMTFPKGLLGFPAAVAIRVDQGRSEQLFLLVTKHG